MATFEVVLDPDPGLGTTGAGDAHAQSIETAPNTFDETLTTGFVGRAAKGGVETDLLVRHDVSGIPQGSTWNKCKMAFKLSANAVATGTYGVGFLQLDTIWETYGFPFVTPSSPSDSYSLSFLNPDPSNLALPHPLRGGTGAIINGVIVFNGFAALIPYGVNYAAEVTIVIGDGYPNDHDVPGLTAFLGALRNGAGPDALGTIFGSLVDATQQHRFFLYMSDHPTEPGLQLTVDYTENFPDITSEPVITPLDVGDIYGYTVVADNPVEPPTPDDIVFSMIDAPSNSGVNPSTGIFVWQPLAAQAGIIHELTVRATNVGGLFDEQTWFLEVLSTSELGCVQASKATDAAVGAATFAKSAVDAILETFTAVVAAVRGGAAVVGSSLSAAAASAHTSAFASVTAVVSSFASVTASALSEAVVTATGELLENVSAISDLAQNVSGISLLGPNVTARAQLCHEV